MAKKKKEERKKKKSIPFQKKGEKKAWLFGSFLILHLKTCISNTTNIQKYCYTLETARFFPRLFYSDNQNFTA